MKSVNFEFWTDGTFDRPASVQTDSHARSVGLASKFLNHPSVFRVGLQVRGSSHLNDCLHSWDEGLVSYNLFFLIDFLFKLFTSFLFSLCGSLGS